MTRIEFNEEELLLIAAAICVAAISSGTPKMFDALQLSETPGEFVSEYARGCVVIIDNRKAWKALVDKMSKASE